MQPRGVLQEDGAHPLPCEDGQGTRVQGPAPREQREEGRAGRARRPHRPGGRPPAEGRHQLAGDIRAAARPGLRRRPHHGEDPHAVGTGADSWCEGQWETSPAQPEELPTQPVGTVVEQIAPPRAKPGFERFDFGRAE